MSAIGNFRSELAGQLHILKRRERRDDSHPIKVTPVKKHLSGRRGFTRRTCKAAWTLLYSSTAQEHRRELFRKVVGELHDDNTASAVLPLVEATLAEHERALKYICNGMPPEIAIARCRAIDELLLYLPPRSQLDGDADANTPSWDMDKGELSFRGELVRKYSGQAVNIRTVLNEFQQLNWPSRIVDPLPNSKNQARVTDTVTSLNSKLKALRFFGGGDGESFCWEVRSD
mgnify:CR=1 FL=1